ncbi:hypothetical protein HELRODRAFT_177772 [Helobdella robusta]|uniref:WSC domain-containing protein n=1 Tax=Helobdella robusta TaxID=6412 RepID=T1FC85_HELRO|nr:hypothetical protein HELRODRAFT_177772 [Helobdella robusta]ESN97713.1 hypothetical protein HELRODRAFT_177772 [Helobdella robusta]
MPELTIGNHIGCHEFGGNELVLASPVDSAVDCSFQCRTKSLSFDYYGVKAGRICSCFEKVVKKFSVTNCVMTCHDGDLCGGKELYSVYSSENVVIVVVSA